MIEVPFNETVNLFLELGSNFFRCRIFHPSGRELFGVQISDFVVSTTLINTWSFSMMRLAHWYANLLKDSSTMSHFANSLRM